MIPHHELGNEILTLSEYDMCVEEGVLASPFKYLIRDWRRAIVLSNEARTRQCHFSLHLSQFCSSDHGGLVPFPDGGGCVEQGLTLN